MINLIAVPFDFNGVKYFSTNDENITLNTLVVCDTSFGTYIGKVSKIRTPRQEEIEKENFNELFPVINRIADSGDLQKFEEDKKLCKKIVSFTQNEADKLKLDMTVLNSYVDLSSNKILITFQSENRVDFRELVKEIMTEYKTRVELRQLGPRDYASVVGGIGPCGLPLCCSTFLNSFDGITLNMAKNQLLTINISKLSGQCGKLLCCLKYEDEAYSLLKPMYPKIGDKLPYRGSVYEVTSINLLSDNITCYNGTNYENFTRQEYDRALAGIEKKETLKQFKDINSGVNLSGQGIDDTNNRIEQINRKEHELEFEKKNNEFNNSNRNNKNKFNKNGSNKNFNRNNQNFKNHNRRFDTKNQNIKKESGFIPVSAIQDRSILDLDKKDNDDQK